jgi:hypothetical protein
LRWRLLEGELGGLLGCIVSMCIRGYMGCHSRRDVLESPDTVLMKICIVSSGSEVDELMLEMLEERRMLADSGV